MTKHHETTTFSLIERLRHYSADWRRRAGSNAIVLEAIDALSPKPVPVHPDDPTEAQIAAAMKVNWEADIPEKDLIVEIWHAMNAAEPVFSAQPAQLPQDVINLVIAAREVAYEDFDPEKMTALDKAVEAFGERVPWDNEPEISAQPHPVETVQADVQPVAYLTTKGNQSRVVLAEFVSEQERIDGSNGWAAIPLYPQAVVAALKAERDEARRLNAEFKICEDRDRKIMVEWASRCETTEASLAERDAELKTAREYLDGQIHEWMLKYREASAECSRLLSALTACQKREAGLQEVLETVKFAMEWAAPHLEVDPITEERGINGAHAAALELVKRNLVASNSEGA